MRRVAWLFFIVGLFLIVPTALPAASRFQRFDFKLKGEVIDVIMEDLNDDKLDEAIVIHIDKSKTPPGRYLTIYFQDQGGFDLNRKIEWTIPKSVAAVDVGDVLPDKGRELVFITERGISAASIAGGQVGPLKEMLKAQSVVAIAYNMSVPYYNFVRDYTGDGLDDMLICGFYDAILARREVDGSFSQNRLNFRPGMDINAWDDQAMSSDQEHPTFRVSYSVPRVYSEDFNADGLLDLIVNNRNEVQVFLQNDDGFARDPSEHFNIKVFKEEQAGRRGPNNHPNINFSDLDGDGKTDIIANQLQGDLTNLKSRVILFWGKTGSYKTGRPDLELKPGKPSFSVIIRDVNKDKRLDLIMPMFDFSAWTAGKILVTGDVKLEWAYFIQKPDRTFNASPDRIGITMLKINITKFKLESGIPNIFGDFNGDGYPDQIVGEDKEVLGITLHDGKGNNLPIVEKIQVPASLITRTMDINGDGLSDLELQYIEDPLRASEVHIFINRGPWK
jgi:hypothetical protein